MDKTDPPAGKYEYKVLRSVEFVMEFIVNATPSQPVLIWIYPHDMDENKHMLQALSDLYMGRDENGKSVVTVGGRNWQVGKVDILGTEFIAIQQTPERSEAATSTVKKCENSDTNLMEDGFCPMCGLYHAKKSVKSRTSQEQFNKWWKSRLDAKSYAETLPDKEAQ
jgi:hypothetical protein